MRRLTDNGVALPFEPELVRPDVIDARVGPDAVHQGLLAEADPLPSPPISELAPDGIVLLLAPHNVGAIPWFGRGFWSEGHRDDRKLQS
jgi:23S rRNA (guanosine2251-2'-O)-methyltransferase